MYSSKPSSSSSSAGSLKNFEFDFGLGVRGSSRPLREQAAPNQPARTWTNQPGPVVQPARAGLSNPGSMVGDIFGKSWSTGGGGIGVRPSDPTLFGDLVGSALGKGSMKDSANSNKFGNSGGRNVGYSSNSSNIGNLGGRNVDYSSNSSKIGGGNGDYLTNLSKIGISGSRNADYSSNSSKIGGGVGVSKDPFGSLVDFSSKTSKGPMSANSSGIKHQSRGKMEDFGLNSSQKPIPARSSGFQQQTQAKPAGSQLNSNDFGSFDFVSSARKPELDSKLQDPLGDLGRGPIPARSSGFQHQTQAKPTGSPPNLNDFGSNAFDFVSQPKKPESDSKLVDPLDNLFSSTTISSDQGRVGTIETDDWDIGAEFGGNDVGGSTTELEGLPPPPAGISSKAAMAKGSESYKQGQFADGIKWLSWAVVLLEKSGDLSSIVEVLTCRASCYKEVGEIKKAIADCSKILEKDEKNVGVLVQRALLYESSEKYKLGADDLRLVLKLDPMNRVARSTIHRLTQMAG